ncbi:tRNA dihydrouridine(16) synthase DusC [Thalassotalea marina]|uniref:tRNA-dihydrouridine(16) synthase n=1 Tax=Thalassotalea marina TaxID=1673741 RepID=A0A919BKI8_9GAMM|nr:tRNA dihydrouridine(16) synthase DusC [Thalassotalea marina]GHF97795.1 tRNA-dihydrouridine(16) synthase [Thalassotalea marina]
MCLTNNIEFSKVNRITLAPMEGVADVLMRELLTSINQYDLCITEFVRVVKGVVPKSIFKKISPELNNQGKTTNGTPVRVQLLGQYPQWMAENAMRAIELGSHGVDLNFGCPAKTVNKSKGGAVLLKTPETIYQIVSAVRQAVPSQQVVSAKIRLGFDDTSLFEEIVDAIEQAKASELTIHARTKRDGYNPPAYWQHIGNIKHKTQMPLCANGEIWDLASAQQCMLEAKTSNLMLGRGALATPNLANVLKGTEEKMSWPALCELLQHYAELELQGDKSFYFSSRLKQWLRYLKLQYPEAEQLFQQIKTLKNKQDILAVISTLKIA